MEFITEHCFFAQNIFASSFFSFIIFFLVSSNTLLYIFYSTGSWHTCMISDIQNKMFRLDNRHMVQLYQLLCLHTLAHLCNNALRILQYIFQSNISINGSLSHIEDCISIHLFLKWKVWKKNDFWIFVVTEKGLQMQVVWSKLSFWFRQIWFQVTSGCKSRWFFFTSLFYHYIMFHNDANYRYNKAGIFITCLTISIGSFTKEFNKVKIF